MFAVRYLIVNFLFGAVLKNWDDHNFTGPELLYIRDQSYLLRVSTGSDSGGRYSIYHYNS